MLQSSAQPACEQLEQLEQLTDETNTMKCLELEIMFGIWHINNDAFAPYWQIFAIGSILCMFFQAMAIYRNKNLQSHPAPLIGVQCFCYSLYFMLGISGSMVCGFRKNGEFTDWEDSVYLQIFRFSTFNIFSQEEALNILWQSNLALNSFFFIACLGLDIIINIDLALCMYNPMKLPRRRYPKELLFVFLAALTASVFDMIDIQWRYSLIDFHPNDPHYIWRNYYCLLFFFSFFYLSALASLIFTYWKTRRSGIIIAKEQKR